MDSSPIGIDPTANSNSWSINIDGPEIRQLRARYIERGDITPEAWDDMVGTAAKALSQCPQPSGPERTVTGLALGRVQSGKTMSYTTLTALASDNGYGITVVLTGTKNPLLMQTYDRLSQHLDTRRRTILAFKNPKPQEAYVVRSLLHGKKHVLIVALKTRKRIDDVRKLLESPEIKNYPTLIIDDEGDEASLNTQFRTGEQSAVYSSIDQLKKILTKHAYIAYTATPQANLLIDSEDVLSPEFAVLVEPGTEYCGGSVFFGERSERFLRIIPSDEGDPERAAEVTDGMKSALAIFLAGGAVKTFREPRAIHSMLIHTSHLRNDHIALGNAVLSLVYKWQEITKLRDDDPEALSFWNSAREAYYDLCKTKQSPPTWEEIKNGIKEEVWDTEVTVVNSSNPGRDLVTNPPKLKNSIYIGGNMLGRGVTIPNLAVTYITREAEKYTNADTLEQRARWFGYKRPYLDICRVFLTESLRGRYVELYGFEEDFWETLQRNERQGLPVKDWYRMFRLDTKGWQMHPTRRNVASYKQFRGEGWTIQRKLVEDSVVAAHNIAVAREFFRTHPGTVSKFGEGNTQHLVVARCPTEDVVAQFLAQLNTEGSGWDKEYIREYLSRMLVAGRLTHIEVLFMSNGQFRERKREGFNPMQGWSSAYPGDDSIHNNNVQLQVHLIRLKEDEKSGPIETTAVALYVPENDSRYDFSWVIRGDEQRENN